MRGGSGHVRVGGGGEGYYGGVSADTMKLLLPVRRDAGQDELVLTMTQNQIPIRIGAAARQTGLREGYSGDSPSPWASVKLRFRASTARSAARWGNVAAYGAARITIRVPLGNELFESQTQLFPTKRTDTL